MERRPNPEKVDMIFAYGQSGGNLSEAVRIFNNGHPESPPTSRTYIRSLVDKFRNFFSVKDAPRSGRPKSVPEDEQINVLADFVVNPRQSIRKVAAIHEVPRMSVQRLLKLHKFHPYTVKLVHEINEDDPDRRLQFCETMEELIRTEPGILKKICFSDESTFFLNGEVNRHNCRYWATENPHEFRETHTQFPVKVNVWCGILGDKIVGPFFLDQNLDGPLYLTLLEDAIVPKIVEIIESGNEDFDPWFQQDGAPPHFALAVRNFLNAEFPGRWIGRRGSIEWPARSPDLNPLDFFLWGHLKSKVFETAPRDIQDLKQRIVEECGKITPKMLENVRKAFEDRLYFCQAKDGAQFEQEL